MMSHPGPEKLEPGFKARRGVWLQVDLAKPHSRGPGLPDLSEMRRRLFVGLQAGRGVVTGHCLSLDTSSSATDNTKILLFLTFLLQAPKMFLLTALVKGLVFLHRFHIKPCKVCDFILILQVRKLRLEKH